MSKWIHTRKGLIEGDLIREDGIWTMIKFKGDHELRSAKPGAMLPFADGEVITVRSSLLKVIPEDATPTTCICAIVCSEDPDENDCEVCKSLDPYAPCPNTGYGCGLFEDDPCECCTDEQRAKCIEVTP